MHLSQEHLDLFYKLFHTLVWKINEKYQFIDPFDNFVHGFGITINMTEYIKVRNSMWENPSMIGAFLAEDSHNHFTEPECDILRSWQNNFLKSKFVVMKHLANYSVVMTMDENPILYAVNGLTNSFEDTFLYPLPAIVELVLLPFMDKIIYDSLMITQNITLGPGIRASLNNDYKMSKAKYGIIETLTGQLPQPRPPKKKPANLHPGSPALPDGVNVPKTMAERYLQVAKLIEEFCDSFNDDDCKAESLLALQTLCRKRPSPVGRGLAETWACGILCVCDVRDCRVDKSGEDYLTRAQVARRFGLSTSTAANKVGEIRKMLEKANFYRSSFFF
jgi:hypothetical protein